jgi:hypothetical protein
VLGGPTLQRGQRARDVARRVDDQADAHGRRYERAGCGTIRMYGRGDSQPSG